MSFRHFANAMALVTVLAPSPTLFAADATPKTTEAERYGTWGVDLDGMDRTVKPGDDFFQYINGKWAASTTIPADQAFRPMKDGGCSLVKG